jgi:hypothetical protein
MKNSFSALKRAFIPAVASTPLFLPESDDIPDSPRYG